ncbi:MAG: ATP-binding protein [Anaerolineae bacterium]
MLLPNFDSLETRALQAGRRQAANEAYRQIETNLNYFMGALALIALGVSAATVVIMDRWAQSRQKQRESDARYRGLFEYAPIALFEQDFSAVRQRLDDLRQHGISDLRAYFQQRPEVVREYFADVRLIDVNAGGLKMYRAADKPQLLASLDRLLPPAALPVLLDELVWIAEGRTQFGFEGENVTLTGERLVVRVQWAAAPGYETSLARVFVAIEDITAQRNAEQALRVSEDRYRLIAENVSETVWLMDLNLKITFISPSVTVKRGYTLEELQALPFARQVTPASMATALPVLAQELTPERLANKDLKLSRTLELEFYRKDGTTFWSEATFTVIRNETGTPVGILGVGRDVTQRKQRERELEALLTVAASLRAAPTRGDMLPLIVNQVQQLLKADGAALVMPHPTTDENVVVLGRGEWDTWTGLRLPFASNIKHVIMTMGRPYLNNNAGNDPETWLTDRLGKVRAVAAVPLTAPETFIGALWIGRQSDLADSDVRLLSGIAEIAANALYRAGIVETLEQRVADRTHELSVANQRLQEVDRTKDQFVSNVSHELRTPLTNIKLYLNLLERGKPERSEEYMQTLRRETARLDKMIEDLLDLSRLDLGVTKIEPVPTDLDDWLRQLIADRLQLANERGLTLEYEPVHDLPLALIDPARLAEVVTNLVMNAIHYTPSGGTVNVSTGLCGDEQKWVTFTVRDTGYGISAKDRPHVFERFYRGEVGRKATAPGTGLGLAISKEIVERLGGRLTLDSEPGQGAAFTVWLRPVS